MNHSALQEMLVLDRKQPISSVRKRMRSTQDLWYLFFDMLAVNLAYTWIFYSLAQPSYAVGFLVVSNIAWFVAINLAQIYKQQLRQQYLQMMRGLVNVLLIHTALLFFAVFLLFQQYIGYEWLIITATSLFILLGISRFFIDYINRKYIMPFGYVIIGGRSTNIKTIRDVFQKNYADKAICLGRFGEIPVKYTRHIGLFDELLSHLKQMNSIQRIVYVDSNLDKQELNHLVELCNLNFIDFMVMPQEHDLFAKGIDMKVYQDFPFITPKKARITELSSKVFKRLFDLLFSSLVIVLVLSWLVPLLSFLIKLESSGPIFFIQKRPGYSNHLFPIIKFRSMYVNNRNEEQVCKDDFRVTKVGSFLRRTSLDEFPQFLNVFLGQMSIVGPRPHLINQTDEFAKHVNGYMLRQSVKPGITGWAQVNGHRGPTETVEKMCIRVEHDIWYIEHWSFWLDLKCVLMTVLNIIRGEENAF